MTELQQSSTIDTGPRRCLREAVVLLEEKATPDEVAAYKRFVLDVASHVAEAHKEEATPVSEAERQAIEKVAATLNPPT